MHDYKRVATRRSLLQDNRAYKALQQCRRRSELHDYKRVATRRSLLQDNRAYKALQQEGMGRLVGFSRFHAKEVGEQNDTCHSTKTDFDSIWQLRR